MCNVQCSHFMQAPSGLFEQSLSLSRKYVVKMSGSIFYKDDVILVRDGLRVLYTMRGIIRLEVANRFSKKPRRFYRSKVGVTFKGYGEFSACMGVPRGIVCDSRFLISGTLTISGSYATFYQLGADPIVSMHRCYYSCIYSDL